MPLFILYLWFFYSSQLQRKENLSATTDILVWKKTLQKFKLGVSEGEDYIRENIEKHISLLETDLERAQREHHALANIEDLEAKYTIHNVPLFVISCIVLGSVVILFTISSLIDLSLAWIAVIGAMIHILLSGIRDVDEILEKVEWSTLIFFAALFILMDTLGDLGLIEWIALQVEALIMKVPEGDDRLLVACLLFVWLAGIASALLDSLPTTTTLLPIVVQLAASTGLPLRCLTWALALGVCLGANATLIGAPVNVVGAGLLEQAGHPVSFKTFAHFGAPVALGSLFIATAYVLIKATTGWY